VNERYFSGFLRYTVPSFLGAFLLRAIMLSCRVKVHGDNFFGKGPVIYSFWHNQELPMIYVHRNTGACCMVSNSKDGELVARIINYLGMNTARGSTRHGAVGVLREMLKTAAAGYSSGLTPDGPIGPRYKASNGVAFIAQRLKQPVIPIGCAMSFKIVLKLMAQPIGITGCFSLPDGPIGPRYKASNGVAFIAQRLKQPVIPIGCAMSFKIVLKKSWDHFRIPLPFGRVEVFYGAPISVGSKEEIEAKTSELQRVMTELTERAEAELKL